MRIDTNPIRRSASIEHVDAFMDHLAASMPAPKLFRASEEFISYEPREGWRKEPRLIEGVSLDVWLRPYDGTQLERRASRARCKARRAK
jgi:hypothetical protein